MANKKSKFRINLLPGKEETEIDRLLSWAGLWGRYILILTEALVLLAFFSRFKYDQELIDLKWGTEAAAGVNDKKDAVLAYKDFEGEFRRIKLKNELYQKIVGERLYPGKWLEEILPIIGNVGVREINIAEKEIFLSAEANSPADLAIFLEKLIKEKPKWSLILQNVNVKRGQSPQVQFSLTIREGDNKK